jgi:hypothetical protein
MFISGFMNSFRFVVGKRGTNMRTEWYLIKIGYKGTKYTLILT